MADPVRESFTHRKLENLESLLFSIAQVGEVNRINDGVPVDEITDISAITGMSSMDLVACNENGFVYIYNGSAWVLFQDYLITAGNTGTQPTSSLLSPEGVITSRFVGDTHIDTSADKMYFNNTADVNTGWKIITSA